MMIPDLEDYFRGFPPPRDSLLVELEQEAAAQRIPIVGPVVGELLYILARAMQARLILELGAATGYSAIFLGQAAQATGGRVVTLERDGAFARRARENLTRAGLAGLAEVRVGQVADLLPAMTGPVDFIFMDIDKEGYREALPHCYRLLRTGGLLVTDNVGFQGADPFNRELAGAAGWRSVPLLCFLPGHAPERDGLSLALKAG
jgi:predicted O-methyltransferase YrrM